MLKPYLNNEPNPLDPVIDAEEVTELPAELTAILETSGLAPAKVTSKDDIKAIFSKHGAGIEDIAQNVSVIMKHGENESARLAAARIAMEVQGIINTIDERTVPEVNIIINGSGNKTLVNLVCPTVG